MKRKLFLGLILSVIAIGFISCQSSSTKDCSPTIKDVFFVKASSSINTTNLESLKAAKTTTLQLYKTPPAAWPYYLVIDMSDADLDIEKVTELSINEDLKMGQMPTQDAFVAIPYAVLTKEAEPGSHTYKYQAVDKKGNKSKIFELTVTLLAATD